MKFYKLVTHSLRWWQLSSFDVIKNCLNCKTAPTLIVDTFWSYSECSKCPSPTFTYSLNLLLKVDTALLTKPAENCPISFPMQLLIQKLFLSSDKLAIKLCALLLRRDISRGFISAELVGHCSFSITCGQFAWKASLSDTCSVHRDTCILLHLPLHLTVWYGILGFNVPLDTV